MDSFNLIESQNQFRLQNIGCDVIFEIGSKSFPAHRLVLMARLEHFRNMFTADMREKKELVIQFDPQIINPTFFDDVLNYVYTSKIELTSENIRAIYKAADYFCFDELTNKVVEHMKGGVKIKNAILYRNICVEFDLESLRDICEQFIIDNLSSDLIKDDLVTTLSFEELASLTDKMKQKGKYEEMFNYSVDWIEEDRDNRTEKLSELLENVPLELLSFNFLEKNVSKNELVLQDIDCLTLLLNAIIAVSKPLHSMPRPAPPEDEDEPCFALVRA